MSARIVRRIVNMANTTGMPDEEKLMTLDDIHVYHTLHTNLRATYSTKWKPWEAFRELVQNWRDGIIRSFNMDEGNFKVIREKKSEYEIIYKVPASPDNNEAHDYLGYIRFSGSEEGGKVEMVNRKATIQPSNFDLGGTTKQANKNQAGEHGDGLKVALLVLLRAPQNHSVSFITGGFRWEPRFDQSRKLVIQLTRMQAHELDVEEGWNLSEHEKGLVPLSAKPREDVKLIIGLGNSVKVQEFSEWTKAALFLHELNGGGVAAPSIVSSAKGDLITSYALRGNIYLKGLLLKASKSNAATGQDSASITGKPLRFGYNFAHGNTNRDRQSLARANDEANAIFAIWAQILPQQPNLILELHSMLNTRQPEYADISQAKFLLGKEIIDRLKGYLFSEPFKKRWYYTNREKDKDSYLNRHIDGLGREPYLLEETYWDILYSHGIVRTCHEERRRRFLSQEEQLLPDTSFANGVSWYLRACLKSCNWTSETRFICVEGTGLRPTTLWESEKNLVRIHKSWFLPNLAVAELGLPIAPDSPKLFFHTVKYMFRDIVRQMPESKFGPLVLTDSRPRSWYKANSINRVELCLLDCTQLKRRLRLSISGPSHQPQLLVNWGSDASWKTSKGSLLVEVHQVSTCNHLKDRLLAEPFRIPLRRCLPKCGSSKCDFGSDCGQATFSGLAENEEYFAVICNTTIPDSFIVVSENTVVMPKATVPPPPSPPQPQTPVIKKRSYTLGEERENLDIMTPRKWYDASNDEGQEAVVGIPPEDAPETSAKKTPAKKTPAKRSAPQTPTAKRVRRS